jgi:hypothetical protein
MILTIVPFVKYLESFVLKKDFKHKVHKGLHEGHKGFMEFTLKHTSSAVS